MLKSVLPPFIPKVDVPGVPDEVAAAYEEALVCRAHDCLRAGAIMTRRALEELCQDQAADGKDLQARIRALGEQVTLPRVLLDGMDGLRLLGNDAAHLECRTFNGIGVAEVDVGLQFLREILEAVYGHADLLQKLESLKRMQQPGAQ